MYRRAPAPELVSTAHHEAAHAVTTVLAFRESAWLPHQPPSPLIQYVEIIEHAPGRWSGNYCLGQISTRRNGPTSALRRAIAT